MRTINRIILHCSDSPFGDAALIDQWHKERGWRGIGYHFVIRNGYTTAEMMKSRRPDFSLDGAVEDGRPPDQVGAHCDGANEDSIGVCLIGKDQFTCAQFRALINLKQRLEGCYGDLQLVGHYEAIKPGDPPKSCPNLDMDWLRRYLGR